MKRTLNRTQMRPTTLLVACALGLGAFACGGETPASDLTIERLPDVSASLPNVPQLPPPPFEVQYSDNCYSIYGVRRRQGTTMGSDVCVTGYIVEMYQAPECPPGRTCDPPAAPHLWLSDTADAGDDDDRLLLAGYAENQSQIDEARELAARGRYEPPDPESGILPIPTDFDVGAKVSVRGHFDRVSGAGFNVSNGMLEYRGHETVEPATPVEE